MANKDGRYRVVPLGLSYDSLVQAAITATKKENKGNKVIDKQTGKVVPRTTLMDEIEKGKAPKPKDSKAEQGSLFEFINKINDRLTS